jgi:hypothetical protein
LLFSSEFSRKRVVDCFQELRRRQVAVRFDVMNNQHKRSKYKAFADTLISPLLERWPRPRTVRIEDDPVGQRCFDKILSLN